MDIDATGRVVAVAGGFDGDLVTYDVDRRRMLGRIAGYPRPEGAENVRDTAAVEFDGRGGVWFASMSGPVRLVDPRSLAVRRTLPLPTKAANNFLTVTPVGVLVGAGDEQIVSIDTRTGQRLWTVDLTDSAEAWPCFSLAVADELGRFYCGSQFGEIDERDLASGQLTGVRLDSQRGETGDLSVAAGGELLEFGRGYYLRWRLDGSGPIARLVAPGALSRAGYDPSGRYLAVHPRDVQGPDYGPHTILGVAAGTPALRLDVRGVPVWIDSHTMRVRGEGDGVLVDVATGRSRIPASDEVAVADEVFAGVDGEHAWASVFREPFGSPASEAPEEVYDVIEFESGTGRLTGRRFQMPGYPYSMFPSSDGNRVWVGYYRPGGSWLAYEDETNRRGTFVALAPVEHGEEMLVSSSTYEDGSGNERLVGSDHTGEIREYDPDTLEPMATLPGSRGFVWNLRFSDDGTRLFASGVDGGLNIYDTRSWIRVATIPSETGAQGAPEGWMRPDGKAVAVNGRLGVAEWTLEPARLATGACTLAGRNLTRAEWATYLGDEPYRRTCPEYPAGE
jgi:hypothetical protein